MSRQGDAASGSGDETSTEWEAETEDEDEASARAVWDSTDDESTAGIYIATVSDEVFAFDASFACDDIWLRPRFMTSHRTPCEQVTAMDEDLGENGTVRYSARARGAAKGSLRVHSTSGRLYASPRLRLAPGDAYDITVSYRTALPYGSTDRFRFFHCDLPTRLLSKRVRVSRIRVLITVPRRTRGQVRACDGGPRPRCGVARAALRGVPRGGAGRPQLASVPPLQVAELDPPGFLLTMLQASDPDGDALFYDILGNERPILSRET